TWPRATRAGWPPLSRQWPRAGDDRPTGCDLRSVGSRRGACVGESRSLSRPPVNRQVSLAFRHQFAHKTGPGFITVQASMKAHPAMAKPTSKVLVINDEPLILKELLKGLNAAARSLDNPFGISFTGALTAKEGLGVIERDGDIQVVIVDDKLYAVEEGPRRSRNGKAANGREPS